MRRLIICHHQTAILLTIAATQIAWTHDISLLGQLNTELARGNKALYPNLVYQTGHPYAYLLADVTTKTDHFLAGIGLNSGRLYPVSPVSGTTDLDNRKMGFVEQLYLGWEGRKSDIIVGRQRLAAARGLLTDAYVPALILKFHNDNWISETSFAKAETDRFFDPAAHTYWGQIMGKWSNDWWTVAGGTQVLVDSDDQTAGLLNPLWPVLASLSPYCQSNQVACLLTFAQNDGFLKRSNTTLNSTWAELSGFISVIELKLLTVFQIGKSVFETVTLNAQNRTFRPRHMAGALDARATWVAESFELGTGLQYFSGDDSALEPDTDFRAYIGTLSYWSDTSIFMSGINADFQTPIFQTAGRLAYGLIAQHFIFRVFGGASELDLQVSPMWSERAWTPKSSFKGNRFYGLETDIRYYWDIVHWLTLSLETDVLTAGDFPALQFIPSNTGIRSELKQPGTIWRIATGLSFSWNQLW